MFIRILIDNFDLLGVLQLDLRPALKLGCFAVVKLDRPANKAA